jgi:hypothetical protein
MQMARTLIAAGMVVVAAVVTAAVVHGQSGTLTTDDYIAIQQLYARYNVAIDTGDAEAWAATFTPDGNFNNSNKGHDALVQFIKDWREKRDGANRRHWNSNLVITPAANGASGSVYLMLMNIGVRPAAVAMTARYQDTLVKTALGWRFKERIIHGDAAPRP